MPLICGILVIVSQLVKNIEDVRGNFKFINEGEEPKVEEEAEDDILSNLKRFEDDDEEEKYDDVKTEVNRDLFIAKMVRSLKKIR